MTTFSVIIPCFNCAATIAATLTSLQAQTRSDWEAICIDDGSADDTLSILWEHAKDDPRIRVFQQDNAGPSRARNAAVAEARAPYVAFLDSDDLWLPTKLASVARAFADFPCAEAVFGQIAFFKDDAGADATTSTVRPGPAKLSDFLGENPVCTLSNLTVRRDTFTMSGGFDESMRFSEDLEWLIRMLADDAIVIGLPDLHVRYRTSENGLSADLFAMHTGWKLALSSAGTALTEHQKRSAEATHLRYLARRALRTGAQSRVAVSLSAKGLGLAPMSFLGGRHRGPLTLAGCLLAPILPVPLRRRLFA